MAKLLLDKTRYGWWKSAVFYQIYPKSFLDTTGSGVGDLRGIIARLDYLAQLGIDGIWMSPVCQSPQVDNGYDISDYCAIDPAMGTMADMEELIAEGKKRGISIILDLVLNHCSDQHHWFKEALMGGDNPYRDYFIWRDGTPDRCPNEMRSVFGGPAWTGAEEAGQWYFHQFAPQQPDLNWENPAMRRDLYKSIRFWVDKGVEGFRLDVIDQIGKDADRMISNNGPRLHEYLQELSRVAFPEPGIVTVGEAWGADTERAKQYSAPDGSELSMVFQFEHIGLDQEPGGEKWDMIPLQLTRLKQCFRRWQQELHGKGWNSLFTNTHDLPRIVSRWGNDSEPYRVLSAKMLATMLHGMEGTPYIYQGEELGMTNIVLPIDEHVDIETLNLYNERMARGYAEEDVMRSIRGRSRDNARTPMQWTAGENAGFTTGKPWIPVNPNHISINAEAAVADRHSVFRHYRDLIRLRKEYEVIREGRFELWDADNEKVFAYTRDTDQDHLLVVCNFTAESMTYEIPARFWDSQMLINNYSEFAPELRPYEAVMLYYTDRKEL